jgi:hypothetical protein
MLRNRKIKRGGQGRNQTIERKEEEEEEGDE